MARYTFVVMNSAVEGREAEFNEWYDHQHVPDVLNVPGYVSAQRFKLPPDEKNPAGNRYLALYELDTDDLAATQAEVYARLGTPAMPTSDAMDRTGAFVGCFEEFRPKVFGPHAKKPTI